MQILGTIDIIWICLFVIGATTFGLTAQFRWISPKALAIFLLYKISISSAFSLWAVYTNQEFDAIGYYQGGMYYSQMFRELVGGDSRDFLQITPFFWTDGISTDRFTSLSGLLLACSGHSFMASTLALCCGGAVGQLLIFRYLRERFVGIEPRYFYLILYHPSSALWSSLMLKDTLGMLALGLCVYHLDAFVARRRLWNLFWLALGVYVAALYRSFILVMIAVFMLFVIWDVIVAPRSRVSVKGGVVKFFYIYFASILAASLLFYYINNYGRDMVSLQQESNLLYSQIDGGSTFNNVGLSYSLAGLLALPAGVINALLRPFPWEVGKMNQFFAATENVIVLIFVVKGWQVFCIKLDAPARRHVRNLLFGTTLMTLICAAGVGLFSSNLGSISRYRIPLVPTFLAGPCAALALFAAQKRHRMQHMEKRRMGTSLRELPLSQ